MDSGQGDDGERKGGRWTRGRRSEERGTIKGTMERGKGDGKGNDGQRTRG